MWQSFQDSYFNKSKQERKTADNKLPDGVSYRSGKLNFSSQPLQLNGALAGSSTQGWGSGRGRQHSPPTIVPSASAAPTESTADYIARFPMKKALPITFSQPSPIWSTGNEPAESRAQDHTKTDAIGISQNWCERGQHHISGFGIGSQHPLSLTEHHWGTSVLSRLLLLQTPTNKTPLRSLSSSWILLNGPATSGVIKTR